MEEARDASENGRGGGVVRRWLRRAPLIDNDNDKDQWVWPAMDQL